MSFSDELRMAAAYSDAAFTLYVSGLWLPPHLRAAAGAQGGDPAIAA